MAPVVAMFFGELIQGHALFMGQLFGATDRMPPTQTDKPGHRPEDKPGSHHGGASDRWQGNIPVTAVHQDDRAGNKGNYSANPQYPEAGHEGLAHNERQSEQNQCQAGVIHRQDLESEERKDQGDGANHARHHRTGVRQLEDDAVEADNHQEIGDVRIGDHGKQARAPIRLGPDNFQAGRVQGRVARRHPNGAAIHLLEQIPDVGRNHVDNVLLKGLIGTQIHSLTDGFFSPVGVAAMAFGQPANVTDRILQNLALHGGAAAPFAVIVAGLLFAVR